MTGRDEPADQIRDTHTWRSNEIPALGGDRSVEPPGRNRATIASAAARASTPTSAGCNGDQPPGASDTQVLAMPPGIA